MSNEIKIYVADLAAYNVGRLHGIWIDAMLEVEEMQTQINAMLAQSPVEGAEEYAIHNYEGFDGYTLSEYAGLETVHVIAEFIAEYQEFGGALLEHFGDLEEAKQVAENYHGTYVSLADCAQELTEQSTAIPKNLRYYIDYQSMARDMQLNGEVFTIETGYKQGAYLLEPLRRSRLRSSRPSGERMTARRGSTGRGKRATELVIRILLKIRISWITLNL